MSSPRPAPSDGTAVLLVDDRPENLLALEEVLAPLADELGVRLLRANSGEEALRHLLVEDGSIALVLLDVMMPGTGGLETARLIRARRASEHVPIIFITALDEDRRRATLGYQFGAVDYLTKPLDAEVLRAKVRVFLDLHRRRTEETLRERRRYADEVHALREAALRDETALIATIQRIGSALASELDLDRLAQLVTDEATELTGATVGAFFYRNVVDPARSNGAYTLSAHAGPAHAREGPTPRSTTQFEPMPGLNDVVRSDDIARDPRHAELALRPGAPFEGHPVRSYLAVPVRSRAGEVLGGLFFGHERAGVFTEREERLVVGVAGWAAVAMDNARLYAGERRARQSAEGAARTKSEFLTTMSHEFRTPLNAVLGYAQLLELGVLGPNTPAQQSHLARLQSSARHLLGLIDDVLDVAKVDADRLVVRRDKMLTGAAVAAAVAVVQPQATTKGVRLVDLGSGDAGVPYIGDEHRVRQVLVNLLANAVKFTPSGGEVTVACGAAKEPEPGVWPGGTAAEHAHGANGDAGNGWAFIRIADTGPGIGPELLGRLFEPFVQGDPALTRTHGGTGLGLAISRRLARLMNGDLVARSQPGAGATFTLWLPGAMDAAALGEGSTAIQTGLDEPTDPRSASARAPRRTPASGMPVFAAETVQMDDASYDVLYALAVRLAAESETVAERYLAALRMDGRFPGARSLSSVQLRDHVTPFVGLVASQLMIIGETRGEGPELLGDGAQVRRVMAELHGAQRYRLGWSEADIEREGQILIAETQRALGVALSTSSVGDGSTSESGEPETPSPATRAAAGYASAAARQMLEQGTRVAVRSYRFAKATSTP